MQIRINFHKKLPTTFRTTFEFHISRRSRDFYQFDDTLFSLKGDTIFANFHGAHLLTNKINKKNLLLNPPEKPERASDIYAIGLVDEIIHYLIGCYIAKKLPDMYEKLMKWLADKLSEEERDKAIVSFAKLFPSSQVYQDDLSHLDYVTGESDGVPNSHIILEEMILLSLGNMNPAYAPVHELIDDSEIKSVSEYHITIDTIFSFFNDQPGFGPGNENLIDMLRTPAKLHPDSIRAQLEYIQNRWGVSLPDFLLRILKGLDFISEEEKIRFDGPGISAVPDFNTEEYEEESERFSSDLDWMPNVVILAKNIYVWLDQLSKKYSKNFYHLDHIPDEELDQLAHSGFTGLWLIGLWERSKASKKIKQICGNPEAVASAYSLHDYVIAADLGGEEAYKNLNNRALSRGIRLASDMVPNHMAIDSKWTMENPDWFIQAEHPPFPSYSFNGQDLSDNENIGIFIEDGYWSKTDAAVVFKQVDYSNGQVRYIYHGNDGTQMPWNDTAQLNYLKGEVREAVIQTIIHVAKKFHIIRFDAAMTLAKRHYQRLWYPKPGTGGDIPSRAEHAKTDEEFNRLFPLEFWREVVDRIHIEAPDTLLMAEAFWMMESYFVRTLGMHRVYNSAFMNMLKNEDNQKLRQYIKNVIEFNPQILKRYVNFMSNPDEDTAIAQFGKEDKYFGTCVMMSTIPGLPMFGHGQVEGLSEKYGMEYRRAYWDEHPDQHLIERHEREIFPLLKKRHLFSDVEQFLFYNFIDNDGNVNEDVFAYSNGRDSERSIFVYNNRFSSTVGRIKGSCHFADGNGGFASKNLGENLQLIRAENYYCIFKDQITDLKYIRQNSQLINEGLYIELGAFKYHVFLEFQQVENSFKKPYAELWRGLNGSGVQSMEESLLEINLRPVHNAFREAINYGSLDYLSKSLLDSDTDVADQFLEKMVSLLESVKSYEKSSKEIPENLIPENLIPENLIPENLIKEAKYKFKIIGLLFEKGQKKYSWQKQLISHFSPEIPNRLTGWRIILVWLFLFILTRRKKQSPDADPKQSVYDLRLEKIILESFAKLGLSQNEIKSEITLIKILLRLDETSKPLQNETLKEILSCSDVENYLQVNSYQSVLWFNMEKFQKLTFWFFIRSIILLSADKDESLTLPEEEIAKLFSKVKDLEDLAEQSGYSLDKFVKFLDEDMR